MTEVLDRSVPTEATGPVSPSPAIDTRAVGVRAALGGAVAMIAGLVADAVAHAADPTLVEREGLLSGTLGHVLLLGGAGVVVGGLALAAAGPALYGPSPHPAGPRGLDARPGPARRVARVVAPVAVLALLAAMGAWASGSGLAHEHDHGAGAGEAAGLRGPNAEPGSVHAHDPAAPAAAPTEGVTGTGGHVHGEGPSVPLDPATQKALSAQVALTHEATMRYPTVADATAAGLRRVGTYAPGSGAHYMKDVTEGFDAARPTMWLYAGNEPTSPVVGVMFYNMNLTEPPEGYAGPNDHWHMHTGVCLTFGPEGVGLPLPVDKDATREQCQAVSGRFMDITGWMIHVWSAPGWESPQGVFSHDNPQLVCTDGKSAADAPLHVGCQGMA